MQTGPLSSIQKVRYWSSCRYRGIRRQPATGGITQNEDTANTLTDNPDRNPNAGRNRLHVRRRYSPGDLLDSRISLKRRSYFLIRAKNQTTPRGKHHKKHTPQYTPAKGGEPRAQKKSFRCFPEVQKGKLQCNAAFMLRVTPQVSGHITQSTAGIKRKLLKPARLP